MNEVIQYYSEPYEQGFQGQTGLALRMLGKVNVAPGQSVWIDKSRNGYYDGAYSVVDVDNSRPDFTMLLLDHGAINPAFSFQNAWGALQDLQSKGKLTDTEPTAQNNTTAKTKTDKDWSMWWLLLPVGLIVAILIFMQVKKP